MGHEVNMVTSWRSVESQKAPFETEEAGFRVHWLPVPYDNRMSYGNRLTAFFEFAWKAASEAASLEADIVFATSTPLTIALPAAYAAKRRKVPMVFEVRDLWPELPIAIGAIRNPMTKVAARRLERYAYDNAAHVVALSPGMRDGVLRAGYPQERVSVIPNSSDLELFDPQHADEHWFRVEHPELADAPLVVYTGTMGHINGVGYMVRIAGAARSLGLGCKFVVVGQGAEEEKVRQEAKRLGVLGDNFHMYPAVPKQQVPNVLAAADLALSLFVDLEAMWANSANKFFDALASGTAIAVNYRGWQADLLERTGAGVVVPADDAKRAAELIGEVLNCADDLARRGKAARVLAEAQFSRDDLARDLERVLVNVVGRG